MDAATDPLYFDHDRTCCDRSGSCGGCVRGIVCHPCNITIASYQAGRIGKKTALLADAIRAYLTDPPARRLLLPDEPRQAQSITSGPGLKEALEIVIKAAETGELHHDDVARIMAARYDLQPGDRFHYQDGQLFREKASRRCT